MRASTLVFGATSCFYISFIFMCFMDDAHYNGWLWGVLALLMIVSFLISLLPDIMINLGYNIQMSAVRKSILCKAVCLILFLGIWSYLDPAYRPLAMAVFAGLLCYELYLTGKITKAISTEKIALHSLWKQIKQVDTTQVEVIYHLLWKSLVAFLVYILLVGAHWTFDILLSVFFFSFQLSISLKIRGEMKRIYAGQEKSIRILFVILIMDTMLIIGLAMLGVKLIFSCVLFGFQWALISDNALKKKTALFRFIAKDGV